MILIFPRRRPARRHSPTCPYCQADRAYTAHARHTNRHIPLAVSIAVAVFWLAFLILL